MISLPIAFTADSDPLDALGTFVDLASPVLAELGYSVEARGDSWAHWTRGSPQNVIRSYAFSDEGGNGVSVHGQGAIPLDTAQRLCDAVVGGTGWEVRSIGAPP